MMFPAIKTEDGVIKGKVSFCCRMLKVTRQGFYKYPADMDRPWKYRQPADAMRTVVSEDECSDTCGRIRMYQALLLKQPEGVRIESRARAWERASSKATPPSALRGQSLCLPVSSSWCLRHSRPQSTPDAAAVTMVWGYIGELVFNMPILVGAVKMADRVVRGMMGL